MKSVLIVDDAMFMRYTLRKILEKNGFMVVGEAENGLLGVQKYGELLPDIVTMDITMPELNGIGAVQLIKQINPRAKIVMISAMGQEQLVREAILAGASNFLVKPFSEERFIEVLNSI
ncbi:response regulator [Syntrophomonas wolfei]|uniref:Stage 0 sporulation protein A homolog n=1 Tax=Syntrophomonas wolfei TaxID=863 RepID=A0A354YST0_9FIRM|nr:response regulator [Syntrophomonas wolfei]HBK52418.1 response regulator [Syntrophomonas wolfei]